MAIQLGYEVIYRYTNQYPFQQCQSDQYRIYVPGSNSSSVVLTTAFLQRAFCFPEAKPDEIISTIIPNAKIMGTAFYKLPPDTNGMEFLPYLPAAH